MKSIRNNQAARIIVAAAITREVICPTELIRDVGGKLKSFIAVSAAAIKVKANTL
jgi:hypothetical protein